jgi:SAM-dependent methyltransferase
MVGRGTRDMREFWDDAASRNAMFYVDTSLDFDRPDAAEFLAGGRRTASIALGESPRRPPGTALAVEIGSGLGRVCAALRESFDHVVGIDISPEMVRQAGELVPDPGVEFRVGDGVSLPGIADASADLVVTFTVFQHAPRRSVIEANIAEAARVLRPGGILAMQWNAIPGPLRWRAHVWRSRLRRRLGRSDRYGRDAPQFLGTRVPVAAMTAILRRAGLEPLGVKEPDTLFTWAWAAKP